LVAGAVLLVQPVEGLKDSKKLSKLQRERLALQLRESGAAIGLGWVWPTEIDEHGLTWAVRTAMARALAEIAVPYTQVIIDGNINYLTHDLRAVAVIKADDTVPAASAASIVAKVARDTYMAELGEAYAGYGFGQHVGYGTAAHLAALKLLGVSDMHRRSFKPIAALV
jgi:ribonuclease HII